MPIVIEPHPDLPDVEPVDDRPDRSPVRQPDDGFDQVDARLPAQPLASPTDRRLHGVFPALVDDNQDPAERGRVRVTSHVLDGNPVWARVTVPRAGSARGTWFIPDVGDEVLVAFEAGDPRRPFVIGSLWNGVDAPPEQMRDANPVVSIVSRRGLRVTLDDSDDQLSITLETTGGRQLQLRDGGGGAVEIHDQSGTSIRLTASGVAIDAAARVDVRASAVKISAGVITLEAGLTRATGVVQCNTLVADAVVASSYTPGAGNIW